MIFPSFLSFLYTLKLSIHMKTAIIGIGGIGGYLGSRLCKTYATSETIEIVFVQRGDHYKAIKEHGLTYITKTETVVKPNLVVNNTNNAGLFDIVFFTVKSRDLESAAASIKGNLHKDSILITLLNGVGNAQRLQNMYPNHTVLNGCIYVSAAIEKPGVVKQIGGAGNLFFGPEHGSSEPYLYIEELLQKAGIKAILSNNILTDVWNKYILICALASITSKYALPIGAIIADEQKKQELICLLQEVITVAKAYNIDFAENIIQNCLERVSIIPYETKTSMQLDIEQGKTPEVDILTGHIVSIAHEKGIAVPVHEHILQVLGYT